MARDGQFFVGPDNGTFSAFLPPDQAVVLDRDDLFRKPVSRTFHGRDVFAPVAARLAAGWELGRVGSPAHGLINIDLPRPVREGHEIRGQVVQVDGFGNLITNVRADLVPAEAKVLATIAGSEVPGPAAFYGEGKAGELMVLVGSSGRIEIAETNGHAARRLKAGVGDEVILRLQ
jgi:hypothetical protein